MIVLLLSQNKFIPQALEFLMTAVYKTIFRTGLGLKYKDSPRGSKLKRSCTTFDIQFS